MSYDISFRVKVEGVDAYVAVGDCTANITWNVRKIIELSTGLPWYNEQNNGLCKDVIPHIENGLAELRKNGGKYKQYEASNGWGTVGGTMRFFETILKEWEDFQYWYPKLVDVATFWIV
jgi:hypothetical protein